jgi:hypothetical protein
MQMTWRTLLAPIGNNTRNWQRGSAIAACLLAFACGSSSSSSTDTRTNWLVTCSDDCDGGLACLCGVCTKVCTSDTKCGEFGEDAVCTATPSSCGQGPEVCAREDFTFPAEFDAAASGSASTMTVSGTFTASDATSSAVDSTNDELTSSGSASTEVSTATDSTSAGDTSDVTGDADAGADPCDIPGREYLSRDPLECDVEPSCGIVAEGIGNVPFSDACGCGCEPYVPPERTDTLLEAECATASSGFAVDARIVVESEISAIACDNVISALLRSQAAVDEWAANTGCQSLAGTTASIDFSSEAVIIVGTADRPLTNVEYVSQTIDGVFHVGVNAEAYCSGAAPTDGYVVLTVPASPSSAVIARVETCYGTCDFDGGLPPP